MIRDIKNLFEPEEEDYYKPIKVGNFYSNSSIEYESYSDRNKTLSIKEYLDETMPYLKDIINNLKTSDTWKIQWILAINFIFSTDTDEEHVMHSKSNIEIVIYDKTDAVEELFESFLQDTKLC